MVQEARKLGPFALGLGALAILWLLVWQAVTADGAPDPTLPSLSHTAVILDSAILVLREGLEAILVLAAITASFQGAQAALRRPVAVGAGLGVLATVVTWFIVVAALDAIDAPALDIQAGTGLLAVIVLLVVMNWFFHRVYWAGWIAHHNGRRRQLLALPGSARGRVLLGFVLLGLTAIYREGFEIVLFLQNLRLQAGNEVVAQGVGLGLVATAIVGMLTFVAHHKLPYKRMLILTGVMLGFVLVVMVGESVQEMQLAGWISTTDLPLPIPDWMGIWFALFPTAESIAAQIAATALVIGSYIVAKDVRVSRPLRRGEIPATRPEQAPNAR